MPVSRTKTTFHVRTPTARTISFASHATELFPSWLCSARESSRVRGKQATQRNRQDRQKELLRARVREWYSERESMASAASDAGAGNPGGGVPATATTANDSKLDDGCKG